MYQDFGLIQQNSKITDFRSSHTFEEGLKETIKYYLELSVGKDLISEIAIKNWEK